MTKNAIGTHRQTFQLNGRDWSLDAAEVDAVEMFLTELRRARYWKHETWCDPKQHGRAAEDERAELDETPCVGRMIQASDELGGWWHQGDVGAPARFYVDRDRRSGPTWDATVDEVEAVLTFLPKDAPVRALFQRAMADYNGCDDAAGRS
ncbi:hypothetical protein [Blastococcus sp. TF02A-35]|uniref:hypothetical protein n=1 Tax=Blastococcus sp. TF02A-35 TaxID=2559612 RepID=UPI00107431DA|nr:hypothetical protein [Blastococcus sp. TF02A_35]TFV52659.1 hypothetical protein E4P43_04995 [Blastococcus sp. TF02A_35]